MESFTSDQDKKLEKEILATKAGLGMWIEDMSDSVSTMEAQAEEFRQWIQKRDVLFKEGLFSADHPQEIILRRNLENLRSSYLAFKETIKNYRNEIELLKADYKVAEDMVLKNNEKLH